MTDSTIEPTGGDDVLNTEQAAEYLKVSRPTILRMIYRGELQPIEEVNTARRRQPRYTFHRAALDAVKNRNRPPKSH